jgi:hypothetical protein
MVMAVVGVSDVEGKKMERLCMYIMKLFSSELKRGL